MPHLHFTLDAYGAIEENANNLMSINELLCTVTNELDLSPVMPPFLVPYYYCKESEDGGISSFVICRGGHVTIHTFPYRGCYFVDIFTDEFITMAHAESIFKERLYAKRFVSNLVDRRLVYNSATKKIDSKKDFGPHYMIEVENMSMSIEWIYNWLDTIAEKINMVPITRPYVICDKRDEPEYVSGLLVVAQSHIAVHYNIKTQTAYIDIFSCEFLDNDKICNILNESFGDKYKCYLVSRGSKHDDKFTRRNVRLSVSENWKNNI